MKRICKNSVTPSKDQTRIDSIKEGEEIQANRIHNTLNKIITEIFPSIEKTLLIQEHMLLWEIIAGRHLEREK
jgi:hypothetical protein